MPFGDECKHELEFLGEQKTEEGANRYYRCRLCGDVFVFPPKGEVAYRIPAKRD